jgi:hypothetical protein
VAVFGFTEFVIESYGALSGTEAFFSITFLAFASFPSFFSTFVIFSCLMIS